MLRYGKSFASILHSNYTFLASTFTFKALLVCLLHAIFYLTIIIHNNHQAILLRHHHHQHYHGGFHHIRMEKMTTFARNISSEFPNKSHWKIWRMNFDLCGKFTFYTKQNANMERRHCVAGIGIGIDAYVCHPSIHHRLMNEHCYTRKFNWSWTMNYVSTWRNWLRCEISKECAADF